MLRVLKTTFRTSKHELDRLFACNRESAKVHRNSIFDETLKQPFNK